MVDSSALRTVSVTRTAAGQFTASNVRGGRIEFGGGDSTRFTPVELLLAAIGGCTGIDVDILTSRRAEPDSFVVDVQADKIRDEGGNRLTDVVVTFRVEFPEGDAGDAARAVLPDAVRRSHDRLCTVSRTVALPTSVRSEIAGS
jgi:uncharacterized OsmC-like protein